MCLLKYRTSTSMVSDTNTRIRQAEIEEPKSLINLNSINALACYPWGNFSPFEVQVVMNHSTLVIWYTTQLVMYEIFTTSNVVTILTSFLPNKLDYWPHIVQLPTTTVNHSSNCNNSIANIQLTMYNRYIEPANYQWPIDSHLIQHKLLKLTNLQ